MHVTPPLPLLKRVPPGAWTIVAWFGGLVFTFLARVRLPGEIEPGVVAAAQFFRWDGLTNLAVATAVALSGGALLRCRPLPALWLLMTGSVLACLPLGVGAIPLAQYLAVDVAVFFIAAGRARRTGVAALAGALAVLAGYLTTRLLFGWPVGLSAELAVAMTVVIAWLIGHSVRQAREHAETLIAKATVQAATDERLRISRELHDTVAHSITVIALQAGAARRVIDTQPDRASQALGEIETVGRETLSGLRRMLGALRHSEEDRPHDVAEPHPSRSLAKPHPTPGLAEPHPTPGLAEPHPTPSLADLDRLAAATTDAGVRVEVHRRGEPYRLPPEIDISAYRIVQEAVTNVVRHAGTGSCRVFVEYGDGELALEVLDDGHGPRRTSGGGYGLVGMRERVSLLHGTFSAGPRPGGGFRVAARLPLTAAVR
ncbi:sensor histidine kinase [Nonomuraea sp. NPDC049695]|uniref:sensor histidine kinase n=1 Tax=Nonomuraea sp. NPDC049695 TaxID=3154734 RepID=UPI0034286D83